MAWEETRKRCCGKSVNQRLGEQVRWRLGAPWASLPHQHEERAGLLGKKDRFTFSLPAPGELGPVQHAASPTLPAQAPIRPRQFLELGLGDAC